MKKTIFSFIFFIILCLIAVPTVFAADGSAEKGQNDFAELISGQESKFYEKLDEAIDNAKDGDTIKLVNFDISSTVGATDNEEKEIIIGDDPAKQLTIDLNGRAIRSVKLKITNGSNITFKAGVHDVSSAIGGLINDTAEILKGEAMLVIDGNSTVTFDGLHCDDLINEYDSNVPFIEVNNGSKLILKNDVKISAPSVAIKTSGTNSSINVQSTGLIEGDNYAVMLTGTENTLNIQNGELNASAGYAIYVTGDSVESKVLMSGGKSSSDILLYGSSPSLEMTGGSIETIGYGIYINGQDAKVDIKNAKVSGGFGGIVQTESSENSTININEGGTIKGVNDSGYYNEYGKAAAFLLRGTGVLNINDGEITGEYGIVTYGTNVNINKGKINATGSESGNIISDAEGNSYDAGIAVIVNNKAQKGAKVTINGGEFISVADKSLLSVEDNNSDFSVGGGIFDKPFKDKFVVPNKLELKVTNADDTKWYVGQDAKDILEEVEGNSEYTVEVLQEETPVEPNEPDKPDVPDEPQEPDEQVKPDNNEPKNPENVDETNPNTADNIIFFVVLLIVSAVGIGGAVYFKRKMNK